MIASYQHLASVIIICDKQAMYTYRTDKKSFG